MTEKYIVRRTSGMSYFYLSRNNKTVNIRKFAAEYEKEEAENIAKEQRLSTGRDFKAVRVVTRKSEITNLNKPEYGYFFSHLVSLLKKEFMTVLDMTGKLNGLKSKASMFQWKKAIDTLREREGVEIIDNELFLFTKIRLT